MSLKDTFKLIHGVAEKYLIDKPYAVGGLPRDIYLKIKNIKTTDIDVTTNSPEILRLGILVADELNVTFDLADDGHLTVFAEEYDIDFSSHFISAEVVKYLDGKYSGLEEAFSRDFTINALHLDLVSGEITDPTGQGFDDAEQKIIRTPVPAKITLTDDPRRAYRAVNLASRYGFDVDEEIKSFVRNNLQLFHPKKIKDKFVTAKISKAVQENPALTIRLLKEMGLFKFIPLAGEFKEFLIDKKMLADYLSSPALDAKSSVATDWQEYISQGSAYQDLAEWWQKNYQELPGNWDSSYKSWTQWYMNKFREEWSNTHKGPEETLEIMKSEAESIAPILPPKKELNKMPGFSRKLKKMKSRVPTIPEAEITGEVIVNPGINLENVTASVKEFVKDLGNMAAQLGVQTPIVTSGWRSIESQAKVMANNWQRNGGLEGGAGRKYLEKLYGKSYGGAMADIFEAHGISEIAIQLGMEVILKQPSTNKGGLHISNPGQAIDIAATEGILDVLGAIRKLNKYKFKVLDETKTAGPHYHISILS